MCFTVYSPSLGSPLDFYHTPPTSPSEAEVTAMASPSAASTDKVQTSSPVASTTPSTPSQAADWKQKLSAPSEWAVISVESINSSDAAAGQEKDVPIALPLPRGSPSEQSWQERDSGMELQAAAERPGEEMTLVLLSLMEHYRASLGLTPNTDITTGAVGMGLVFLFLFTTDS